MKNDVDGIFERYVLLCEQQNQNLGQLIGAQGGGEGGNWGGSLPKLISLLPMGNWKASSLKRQKVGTKSGFMSDHYIGNNIAYAADFGLNSTFNSNVQDATNFAIKLAKNAGANISSWDQFKGNQFKMHTPDGFRIQIIWLSNVGGNHYDHVHVGVKREKGGSGADYKTQSAQDDAQNQEDGSAENATEGQPETEDNPFIASLKSLAAPLTTDFSPEAARSSLKSMLGQTWGAIQQSTGKKLF